MDRGTRRDLAKQRAVSRKNKLIERFGYPISIDPSAIAKWPGDIRVVPVGYFRNNNEANKFANAGRPPKTNRKKAHAAYRDKLGGYGKPMNWSASDQRKLDALYSEE